LICAREGKGTKLAEHARRGNRIVNEACDCLQINGLPVDLWRLAQMPMQVHDNARVE
jgi:hypothetical protein